jgi:hypothetical protein
MLAVLHGGEADLGAHRGLAGGVDDHVDMVRGADELCVLRDRRLAGLQRGGKGGGRSGNRALPSSGRPAMRSAFLAESMLISAMAATVMPVI